MARRSALIAALVALVLLGHGLALEWLTRQAQAHAAMRLMATPMFTRLLQPQNPLPPPISEGKSPGVQAPRLRPAIKTIAPSIPASSTSTVATPELPAAEATAAVQPTATSVATATPPEQPTASEPPAITVTASASPVATATTATTATTAITGITATTAITSTSSTSSATSTTSAAAAIPGLDSWPGDTRLNYKVGGYFRGELHGNARVQWQREGERYQTRVDIDLGVVGLVMTSQGEVTAQGLSPTAYEESRAGKRRSVQMQEQRVLLSDGTAVARPEGVQDTASQFVELSHRFASGLLPLEVGRSVTFPMARPGGVDVWTYDIVGKDMLQTPRLGAVEAFHLKPRPLANPRGNITAEMWFAPSLQYLPVRIRVSLGDAYVDLFVETIEQR